VPISFLTPLFLAGLIALAVPIVIHLTDRERRDVVRFPSLMFVRRIPHKTVRRQRIRHWLVFAMRAAAVALLAVAFARPLLEGAPGGAAMGGAARHVVILLDRSLSMGYGDRWARAVGAAREVIDGLGDDDRGMLVAFAEQAEALTPPDADAVVLRATLDGLRPSDGGTRFGPAVQMAGQILDASDRQGREVVLISDFQRTGWNADEVVRLSPGISLEPVDVGGGGGNRAVLGVEVDHELRDGVERVAVAGRVANLGDRAVGDVRVELVLDGQVAATQAVTLAARTTATVAFPAHPVTRTVRAMVRLAPDSLPADDAFHFLAGPQRTVPVLLVEHPSAGAAETVYLRRALEVGDDPPFRVDRVPAGRLAPEPLQGLPAVIVNDAPLGDAAGRALRAFVEGGGRVLLVFGRRTVATRPLRALVPAALGPAVDRLADRGGTMSQLDYDHPALELFRAPRTGDFTTARFFRYRRVTPDTLATVLARFDDGAPALLEWEIGAGRVLLLTTGLDTEWNDLALQPVFVPLVHRLVRYLRDDDDRTAVLTVGHVLDLAPVADSVAGAGGELVVETPAGAREVADPRGAGRLFAVRERGFYVVRPLGGGVRDGVTVPVNVDPRESDLAAVDADEVAGAAAAGAAGERRAVAGSLALSTEERERRQALWWYLVVGVLLLFLGESVIANRLSRGSSRPPLSQGERAR
jgi:hypothetical protein